MIPMLFLLILIFHRNNGKFLLNSESSSIIVLRHIRLSTDNEYYRIRCPYNLNHLSLTLLNYSNENCFDLYTKSIHNDCVNNRSPCRFYAKSTQLNCNERSYSNHVDVTYQCSFLSLISSSTISSNNEEISTSSEIEDEFIHSSSPPLHTITLHALSFPSTSFDTEESVGIFLIGLATVCILWLTVCCMWFMRCGRINKEDDGKCELLSFGPYTKDDNIDFTISSETKSMIVGNLSGHTSTGGLENICVYVNPLENKRISSLNMTQID
ncbi:unnamed protein product [Rotaria sordida]|uniref:SUEL-type lectin domain-containing protein n=1 Tax=Rotaria sordida TaxID=392033 RepID=A0A814QB48_9BILA|nr:unnamed protein product [Rotaria sordida]CAF1117539.1 unnamed protein product [Rotaria sordida]CAF1333056.1 unnamed protein product [Rotaria sordida]CAF1333323.1 unnamed protein product [Rotaria sordida]